MPKIGLIGEGEIGGFVARKLKDCGFEVLLFDIFSTKNLQEKIKDMKLVISLLPARMVSDILLNLVEMGISVVIPSSLNNVQTIAEWAKDNNSVVVAEAGLVPGLSNMLVGAAHSMLGGLTDVRIYGGVIPEGYNPYLFLTPNLSKYGWIEIYLRPARFIVKGSVMRYPPLHSFAGRIYVESVGELEYFPFDGLGSLLKKFEFLNFGGTYLVQWPGHLEFIQGLKKIGLLENRGLGKDRCGNECRSDSLKMFSQGVRDLTILIVEAFKGKKGVRFTQIVHATQKISAKTKIIGSFLVYISLKILENKISGEGVIFPEDLGVREDVSVGILENFARDGMPVKEEFLKRKIVGGDEIWV